MKKYKFLSHTADVKFQAFGNDVEECFVNAGNALMHVMYEGKKIKNISRKKIKVSGKDFSSLLYNFLEEFLFFIDAKGFVASKIENLNIDGKKFVLSCEVVGDSAENYKFSNPVKAITYNEMFVKKEGKKFICQVVLDV